MDYLELIFNTINNSPHQKELLIAKLYQSGFDSFEEAETVLKAFVPLMGFDLNTLKSQLADTKFEILEINQVSQKNWNSIWESSFEPVVISDDCQIRATFHEVNKEGEFDILLDPKMAFGTGHHDTTFLMMQSLLSMNLEKKTVLDVGCGTSILSILAEKKSALSICAIDVDKEAYSNSLENIKLNNCNRVSVSHMDVFGLDDTFFDVVLANINRNVLLSEMREYVMRLSKGGLLVLSGFFDSDFDKINNCVLELGLILCSRKSKNKWQCLVYKK
ncbi:MAG: 50S ribosomal protein L11 methyltransferase [Flavobacteriales bacterium]|nr:50S ribosomal protein L11 methyltransferase [Flavobacteriales bacterium]